jgi:predicted nucleic acid-binding protein
VIAADTSTWIAFLQGDKGKDVQALDLALLNRQLLMVPVVLTELLSDPALPHSVAKSLSQVPAMEILPGFWERAGALRSAGLAKGRKARLGDALIAQFCLDRGVSLLTRDRDFRSFSRAAGLAVSLP